MRFVLSGDFASASKTFGGIGLQFAHLGDVLRMSIAENAPISQLYGASSRAYADELSKFREREADIIKLLQEADRRIKRDVLQECGAAQTFARPTWKPNKGHKGKEKRKGKGQKGRGEQKGRPSYGKW